MKIFVLLCILATTVTGYKHFENHKLKPGDTKNIWPVTNDCYSESKWNFEACQGCKIVLSCALFRRNCADHMVTVYNGKHTTRHCGPNDSYLLKTSHKNWMNIIIENRGLQPGSYCHVTATKPFSNTKYEAVDSSEHGLGYGADGQTTCDCGWANKNPARIIGGLETSANEYPFIALIIVKKTSMQLCGASIISPYHVLTAAHCTSPFHGIKLSVIVGEHDLRSSKDTPHTKIIDVEKVYDHPNYNNQTNSFDISVLKLRNKIKFSQAVGPVCLPTGQISGLLNEYVKVLGWGQIMYNGPKSPVLRKVNLKVIDLDICKTIYGHLDSKHKSQICTWGPNKDSCQGDSGGPLVWRNPKTNRYTQVGLVSFARECGITDPGVNTDISYFIDWIKKVVSESAQAKICQ